LEVLLDDVVAVVVVVGEFLLATVEVEVGLEADKVDVVGCSTSSMSKGAEASDS